MRYSTINNLMGWGVFTLSLTVYTLTLEPSVSLWDCGEFTAAADKLQVVHAPGAPLFLMAGRLAALFAPSPEYVSFAVNMLSAIFSALTVMFTFWITTHFSKKISGKNDNTPIQKIIIFSSGFVAAMALTFCDSFWFSAVEAEVYAMSSFFTALTFWAALKWEESKSVYADKWLILIAYLTGLAIGTHLLNLLVIPAIAFIVYFKNFKYSRKGILYCFLIGLGIVLFLQKGIIPGVPELMASMDLFFVNTLGMGFGSGALFAIAALFGLTAWGIYYFGKVKPKRNYQLAFISLAYVLLGYGSYAMVVVRSNDKLPIDMSNPEEPFNLVSYINREQYVQRPLAYGPYFNAPPVDVVTGATLYRKDETIYTPIGEKRDYKYDPDYNAFFPRMGDMQGDNSAIGYRYWGGMTDIENHIASLENEIRQTPDPQKKQSLNAELEEVKKEKPSMKNNLQFFFTYQLNHMYFRYFMWNFAGRQNDRQGYSYSEYTDGNWISGIPILDNMRLGPQDNQPDYIKNNMAKNTFFLIPFIMGILGIIIHFKKQKKDAIVITILFVFTGLLIIVFLNQPPFEPRERDYVHVGSFQTFCIWIGLGVMYIFDRLQRKTKRLTAALIAVAVGLSAPLLMGSQGWDDHDRSGRYIGIDFAKNYLNSCPPNAILLCNGDNDTYPLWYAQNVEGLRRDVRIINQNLLPTDWYSQALLTKIYDSEPLPMTLTKQQLAAGENEYFQYEGNESSNHPTDLRTFISQLTSNKTQSFATRQFTIPVNTSTTKKRMIALGLDTTNLTNQMQLTFPSRGISKGDLAVLDIIATNAERGWPRPICFSATVGSDGLLNMEPYMERRGLVYLLTPVKHATNNGDVTKLSEEVLYDLLMNKYRYYGMKEKAKFFLDDKADIAASYLQEMFIALAGTYLNKAEEIKFNDSTFSRADNKQQFDLYRKRAASLLNKCSLEIPEHVLATKAQAKLNMALIYHEIGDTVKSEMHLKTLFATSKQEVGYFVKFTGRTQGTDYIKSLANDAMETMKSAYTYAEKFGYKDLAKNMLRDIKQLESPVNTFLNGI
ncbi:MAG: DUF2723 domain-containing protein [Bacteroidota bacterium]